MSNIVSFHVMARNTPYNIPIAIDIILMTTMIIITVTLISIMSQIADLLESLFKRHFHVKDSSNLISDYGRVMDLLDGIFGMIMMIITMIFTGLLFQILILTS